MKKIGIVLIILILLFFSAVIAKDAIIKASIKNIMSLATGLQMDIKNLTVSIPKTYISIKGTTILNPRDFDDRVMLDIPEIFIDYNLPSLLRKKIHLYYVRINLKEFIIVKNGDGKTNLDYLKSLNKEKTTKDEASRSGKQANFQIDNLAIKIGKVIYKDYSMGAKSAVSEYKINIDSKYKNIKSTDEIIKAITSKALINTAIGKLSDFDKFKNIASETIEEGKGTLKKTLDELKDIFKSPF